MANKIDIGDLSATIAKELSQYTVAVADGVKAAADETGKELLANTRADAPVKEGKYKRAMTVKTVHESQFEKRVRWYVKSPHYRLSHLLEKGHAKRGGRPSAVISTHRKKRKNREEELFRAGGRSD